MIAATIASALLAAMPAATGDVTMASSVRADGDAASGGITARRTGAIDAPVKIATGRQTLAAWSCARVGTSLRCRSSRRLVAYRRAWRVKAVYVAFGGSRRTVTTATVGRA